MTIIVTRAGKGSPLTNNEMDANLNNLNTQGGTITTVASATTPDIFAVSVGRVVDYTGTATATGFVAAPQAGLEKELICAGAAVFTAGANFIIAGTASASNYTAVAGDRLLIVAETTTKFRMYVLKASGAPNFAAGTVAAPAIYLSTDTGTGLYRIGANNDGFAINGTKLLDLSAALVGITGAATVSTTLGVTGATTLSSTLAAGNTTITGTLSTTSYVGIGTTTPTTFGAFAVRLGVSNYYGRTVSGAFSDAANSTLEIGHAANVVFLDTESSGVALKVQQNGTVITTTSSTGLAVTGVITSTGEIRGGGASSGSGIGTAFGGTFDGGASSGYGVMASGSVQGTSPLYVWNKAASGDNNFIQFTTDASPAGRGSITFNRAGGLTAYNTTSDYRAKDIAGKYETSGETIDQLQVYLGKMKEATISRPMLIAHEAQAVVPYSVTGEKDAEDADGNPIYQQMDHQSFVPLLIAEVQSLRKRISQLEAA